MYGITRYNWTLFIAELHFISKFRAGFFNHNAIHVYTHSE